MRAGERGKVGWARAAAGVSGRFMGGWAGIRRAVSETRVEAVVIQGQI